ncbi:hypothetical protein GQ457_11G024910 [Hibiscus cannabinus]
MELPLEEFDLILGMDWLSEHRVSLDCESKIATLKTPDDRTVILVGERRGYLSNVVSVLTVDRMIRKGYGVFLATILNTKGSLSQIEEIQTVREFPDLKLDKNPNCFGVDFQPRPTSVRSVVATIELPVPRRFDRALASPVGHDFRLRRRNERSFGFLLFRRVWCPFSLRLTECYLFFLKVLVTLPTVHLPSLVPLDPFSPISPSLHDPRLLLIVTRISISFSDCSNILSMFSDSCLLYCLLFQNYCMPTDFHDLLFTVYMLSLWVPTLRPRINPYGPEVTPRVAPTSIGPRVSEAVARIEKEEMLQHSRKDDEHNDTAALVH